MIRQTCEVSKTSQVSKRYNIGSWSDVDYQKSGAIPGNQLKGKYLAKYILVSGSDGYNAVIDLQ